MSVQSSAYETRSVHLGGEEMTVEAAMMKTFEAIQNGLNKVQEVLRVMAMFEEQMGADDEDFRELVEKVDEIQDFTDGLIDHLDELPKIALEIQGPPPPSQKDWYKEHKAARKAEYLAKQEQQKAAALAAKEVAKAAALAAKSAAKK